MGQRRSIAAAFPPSRSWRFCRASLSHDGMKSARLRIFGLATSGVMVKKAYMRFVQSLSLMAALALAPQTQAAWGQVVDAEQLTVGGYRWLEDGPLEGPLYLIISIERQAIHVYDGDRLVGLASVSTGASGHRTPTGEFSILQKKEWHRSNLYSNAPMPFMQRLTWDGIALHAGHNPGYPASHGCIRLPTGFARKLFSMTQIGTLVRVNTDEIRPALMLDKLVLYDPGTTIVTFTPSAQPQPVQQATVANEAVVVKQAPAATPVAPRQKAVELAIRDAPMLTVDPGIFRPRLRR